MGARQVAALVAALVASAPVLADPYGEITTPGTKFYVSIPLGASGAKQNALTYGIQMQGSRPYEVINVDTRLLGFGPLAALEAKWIIAGVVAAGGAYAVSRKNQDRSTSYSNQQNAPCPDPNDPCHK